MEVFEAAAAVALAAAAVLTLIAQWPTSRGGRAQTKRDLEILHLLPPESASRERLLAHVDAAVAATMRESERRAGLTPLRWVVAVVGLAAVGVALAAFGWTLDNPILRFAVVSFGAGAVGGVGMRVLQDVGWLATSGSVSDDVAEVEPQQDEDRDRE